MLTEIKLTNFKCFKEETSIPLSSFNLFTGVNGAGKSTALQALLLMRQSIEHNPYTTELILNGSCVNLGSFEDVKNIESSKENSIYLDFFIKNETNIGIFNNSIRYVLKPKNDEMSLHIEEIIIGQNNFKHLLLMPRILFLRHFLDGSYAIEDKIEFNKLRLVKLTPCFFYETEGYNPSSIFDFNQQQNKDGPLIKDKDKGTISVSVKKSHLGDSNDFLVFNDESDQDNLNLQKIHFISADRIGPQDFYYKSILSDFPNIGTKGEFAVNLLNKKAQELVNDDLCLGEDAKTLITQTEVWLGKILNPLSLQAKSLGKTNFLELLIGGFKPSNVGFGYSSILPIVVTGLIAKPNEKIIIENPEIHLHPKAQSALIDFLVKVANTGVQIFIESHSDHVLNALRIATKNNLLKPEDSSILFFDKNIVNNSNDITSILIDEKGKLHRKTSEGTIAKIPKGFFDEWTNSMAKLF